LKRQIKSLVFARDWQSLLRIKIFRLQHKRNDQLLSALFLIKAESRQHKRNDQLLSALSLFIQRTVK
ncbi:hypothetical protein MOF18_10530, partial [Bacillus licheniformis]